MTPANSVSLSNRNERVGVVVSDKMAKTIVVEVKRRFRHPEFKKVVSVSKKFYAHDNDESASVGDLVRIQETRPFSKLKRWRLVQVLENKKFVNLSKEAQV